MHGEKAELLHLLGEYLGILAELRRTHGPFMEGIDAFSDGALDTGDR